jgi:hypothetical protein
MDSKKVWENGKIREMTPSEIAQQQAEQAAAERAYWQSVSYDDAVDAEIRKRYSVSQEFAILRQREEKPEEYAAYYAYCEECKAFVKAKIAQYMEALK